MITSLVFTDYNSSINVEYKTNLINSTDDNFTVSEVVGLSDAEITFGLNFRRLAYTVASFVAFAAANGLKLTRVDSTGSTVLQDFTENYYGSGLGSDGI